MINKITEKSKELINLCDTITENTFGEEATSDLVRTLCLELPDFITELAEIYSAPEYISHTEDIDGWISIYENLVKSTNSNDLLNFLDIVSYEIKENLLEIEKILLHEV